MEGGREERREEGREGGRKEREGGRKNIGVGSYLSLGGHFPPAERLSVRPNYFPSYAQTYDGYCAVATGGVAHALEPIFAYAKSHDAAVSSSIRLSPRATMY